MTGSQLSDAEVRRRQRSGLRLRSWLSAAAVIALIGSAAEAQTLPRRRAPAKSPAAQTADAGDLEALAKFHARLATLEADKTGNFSRLNVLQIGDSHTAADHFSGRLRNLLQARFGNGGRGFLPPGAPHDYYRPYQVAVTQTGKWQMLSSNKPNPDNAAYGLSGLVARSTTSGDTITIDVRAGIDTLAVGYIRRPDGGKIDMFLDGIDAGPIETRGPLIEQVEMQQIVSGLGWKKVDHPWRIELKARGDGPVEITDISIDRVKGIRVANLGFIGAQVSIMSRWDWATVRAQIKSLDPALIILAFGTNEGHAPVGNIEARYARQLEERLAALKVAAPNASIVVVGTPDANRYPKFCLPPAAVPVPLTEATGQTAPANGTAASDPAVPAAALPAPVTAPRTNGTAARAKVVKPPPPEPPADATCQPLDAAERQAYEQMLADKDRRLCRWHTLPAIPVVRTIQREVAARQGALFYDWFALFESECGADRWFRQGLAHKDRVHFKQDGYWRAADQLYARLMAGYPPPKR